MSNKSNLPRTNRKPCIDYTLVEEFIEQNNLTGKSCGYIEILIHKYYNRHYSRISIGREIRQYCYNKGKDSGYHEGMKGKHWKLVEGKRVWYV